MIYRDWEHYWREGKHGYSSAGREDAKQIWDDLAPTIEASRDDYKNAFVKMANEMNERRSEVLDHALKYIEQFAKPDAPKFWRWYLDSIRDEETL